MSQPIKPPGSTSALERPGGAVDPETDRVEGREGELAALVDEAQETDRGADAPQAATQSSRVGGLQADLTSGRIDANEAIERLVQRALASAAGLPMEQRAALEARLRAALADDPTLIALRKDLERASQT